jgi:hypothetical protein
LLLNVGAKIINIYIRTLTKLENSANVLKVLMVIKITVPLLAEKQFTDTMTLEIILIG